MISDPRISELLVETGAYRDLDKPVILASGQLGIFYINTEKLCQDGGEFERYGDDSRAMMNHAIRMMGEHPSFEEVIDVLAENASRLLPKVGHRRISGGQRRDWIFSGPVANKLSLPHLSIYKDGRIEEVSPDGYETRGVHSLDDTEVVHVVDLITEGSSVYSGETGWVPWLRKKGAYVGNLMAVVDRMQGGAEMLAEHHVRTHSSVGIDEDFLGEHSLNPYEAVSYLEDPSGWSINYLRENGASALVDTFDPNGGKLDRARAFIFRYGPVLSESGGYDALDSAVQVQYGQSLDRILKEDD